MSKIIDLIDSYIERDPAAKGRIEVLLPLQAYMLLAYIACLISYGL